MSALIAISKLFVLFIESQDSIQILSLVIGSGGLLAGVAGGIAVYRKSKPEANKIIVESAQVIVGLQTQTIKSLREELDAVTAKNKKLELENEELRNRLDEVEDKLKDLAKRTKSIEEHST